MLQRTYAACGIETSVFIIFLFILVMLQRTYAACGIETYVRILMCIIMVLLQRRTKTKATAFVE